MAAVAINAKRTMSSEQKTTLCYLQRGSQVLLGQKKRGFGADFWNGFGGKIHEGETPEAAARREILEECGLTVGRLDLGGLLSFTFDNRLETIKVYVFRTTEFSGEPTESEEMRPQWFGLSDLPLGSMWPDDPYWLPQFLAGKKIKGTFHLHYPDLMLAHKVEEVAVAAALV